MSIEQNIPSDPVTRRHWVNYRLRIIGKSFASIARDNQVSITAVRQAFEQPYPKMERIVAEAIGLKPQQLFPERYNRDGSYFRKGERSATT